MDIWEHQKRDGVAAPPDKHLSFLSVMPALTAWLTLLLVASVSMGWLLDVEILKSFIPGAPTMKPGTAFLLAALAVALLFSGSGRDVKAVTIAAGCVALLSAAYLVAPHMLEAIPLFQLAPAPSTSFTLLLLASVLVLLQTEKPATQVIAILTVCAILLPLHRLLTFIVGLGTVQITGAFGNMSLPTSLSIFLLACGCFLHPRLPYAAQVAAANIQGRLLRISLPWTLLIPTLLAILFSIGINIGVYNAEFVTTAVVAMTSTIMTVLLWRLAVRLQNADDRRLAAEQTLLKNETYANQIIEAAPDAMLVVDEARNIVRVNARLEQLFGYPRAELMGQPLDVLLPERFRGGHVASVQSYFAVPAVRLMGQGRDLYARRKDGNEVAVEIGLAPLDTVHGRHVLANIVDISERLRAQAEIKSALREKTLLLNEIHHRVKNNLQIVASLLSLQASQVDEPAFSTLIAESEGRVRAMALMHQVLYEQTDFARVKLDIYLKRLADLIAQIHGATRRGIVVQVQSDQFALDLTRAIPLGLIVNELLSNAFKHAFPQGNSGEVWVELREATGLGAGAEASLVVRDNGRGLPAGLSSNHHGSLGMQIVRLLSEQIGATLEIGTGPGASFTLRFASLSKGAAEAPAANTANK